ncbi:hypothetical protein QYF61_021175 [Mycteria americana]|uniref:Uncharacterized protein n=1 Tax=Mycteria americana TaxID=33587 RepID=A0AAN7MTT8_MYCAM|nr:hypothetical protein QYF61_021175 [Mycteria americana]
MEGRHSQDLKEIVPGDKDGICDESCGRRGEEVGDPPNRSWNNSGALERGRLREQREFSSHNIPGCSMTGILHQGQCVLDDKLSITDLSEMTHIRQEYETTLKGLMPASLRQELEDTIVSLKSQVNILQKRVSVLQEELNAYHARRRVPVAADVMYLPRGTLPCVLLTTRHSSGHGRIQARCPPDAALASACYVFTVVVESDEVSPQPPFLQAEQPQVPQPLPISLVLQTLPQLRCPSLDTLQPLNVSLGVRGPTLNTAFEVRPHQCRVQGHDHCPAPAGHAVSDTSQDAIGPRGHLGTLLAHIQEAVNQHPQVLFCWAAFQPLFPKPVALHGVAVAQGQDLALGLVEPHTIDLGPWIQPVQVPLQSLPALQQINAPAQLGVICKLTEGALDPLIQIIDKELGAEIPAKSSCGTGSSSETLRIAADGDGRFSSLAPVAPALNVPQSGQNSEGPDRLSARGRTRLSRRVPARQLRSYLLLAWRSMRRGFGRLGSIHPHLLAALAGSCLPNAGSDFAGRFADCQSGLGLGRFLLEDSAAGQRRDGEPALGGRGCSWLGCPLWLWQGTLGSPLTEDAHNLFFKEVLKLTLFIKVTVPGGSPPWSSCKRERSLALLPEVF